MAKGINEVTLLGNLGKAPEIRNTQGGLTIAEFSLATPERVKQGNEWKDTTEWHRCTAFGKLAEILQKYTDKGSKIHLKGRLQTQSWDDKKTGEKKYRTAIIVSDVILLDSRKAEGAPARSNSRSDDPANQYFNDYADQGIDDSDIPF